MLSAEGSEKNTAVVILKPHTEEADSKNSACIS